MARYEGNKIKKIQIDKIIDSGNVWNVRDNIGNQSKAVKKVNKNYFGDNSDLYVRDDGMVFERHGDNDIPMVWIDVNDLDGTDLENSVNDEINNEVNKSEDSISEIENFDVSDKEIKDNTEEVEEVLKQDELIDERIVDELNSESYSTDNVSSVDYSNNTEEVNITPVENTEDVIEEVETLGSNHDLSNEENVIETLDDNSKEELVGTSDVSSGNFINELRNRYANLPKSNYHHECGKLTSDQLINLGLINQNGRTSYGKDLARVLASGQGINSGHTAIGYEISGNQIQTLEDIINQNGGSVDNLVISFNPGGSFGSNAGHVLLVSKIENGMVYFIDDFGIDAWGTKGNAANVISVQQFENTYLQGKNKANYMTHII